MRMVGVAVDGVRFTLMIGHDATHDLFQLIPKGLFDEVLPSFYRKNKLNVELGVGVGHALVV